MMCKQHLTATWKGKVSPFLIALIGDNVTAIYVYIYIYIYIYTYIHIWNGHKWNFVLFLSGTLIQDQMLSIISGRFKFLSL